MFPFIPSCYPWLRGTFSHRRCLISYHAFSGSPPWRSPNISQTNNKLLQINWSDHTHNDSSLRKLMAAMTPWLRKNIPITYIPLYTIRPKRGLKTKLQEGGTSLLPVPALLTSRSLGRVLLLPSSPLLFLKQALPYKLRHEGLPPQLLVLSLAFTKWQCCPSEPRKFFVHITLRFFFFPKGNMVRLLKGLSKGPMETSKEQNKSLLFIVLLTH